MLWVRILLRRGVLDTTLCDKVCQWIAAGQWFSLVTPVSSTNKTDHQDLTEILLKVALNNIKPNQSIRIEEVSFSIKVFELHILKLSVEQMISFRSITMNHYIWLIYIVQDKWTYMYKPIIFYPIIKIYYWVGY